MKRRSSLLAILTLSMAVSAWAQTPAAAPSPAQAQPRPPQPPPIVSPEVHADRTVTFRFRDPNAQKVVVNFEGVPTPYAMQKDDQGVWSFTTQPLEPDYYGYSFVADGVSLVDPSNYLMKPNYLSQSNMVHVPGDAPQLWEAGDVPHGVIHHFFYHSGVVGDDRDYFVYTPPGYDENAKTPYPTFYLLHGFSDGADGWTAVGRANFIFDNLLAQGKVKPMVVVMTLGYGTPEILHRGPQAFRDPMAPRRNMEKFGQALLTEVIPRVEHDFHVSTDANQRAIAGLSMGGAESLFVGLNNPDHFTWIGAFSAGGVADDIASEFPAVDASLNGRLHVLWISCGTDDRLIDFNRKFRDWLTTKGVKHTDIETPGMHTWMVWRRNLSNFAPLLFTNAN